MLLFSLKKLVRYVAAFSILFYFTSLWSNLFDVFDLLFAKTCTLGAFSENTFSLFWFVSLKSGSSHYRSCCLGSAVEESEPTRLLLFLQRYKSNRFIYGSVNNKHPCPQLRLFWSVSITASLADFRFEKESLSLRVRACTSLAGGWGVDFLTEIKPLLHPGLRWKHRVTRLGEFQVFLPREAIFRGRVRTFVFRNKAPLWCV